MSETPPATPLSALSDALAAAVEGASKSVVRVEARRRGYASGVAWSADGLVVTAHHAVQREERLRVGLPGGETVPAQFVGRDPGTDLAVLRVEAALHPPAWAEAETLAVGHLALSVGRHGEPAQASLGVVAQRGGAWRTPTGGKVDAWVQTDIAVYPGFSGSALVDARGRVAGVNTSWFHGRASLAIPAATLRRVVGALAAHGRVRRGWLGVATQPVRLPEAAGQPAGLLVSDVEDGSPAALAGVLLGDVLLGLGDVPVGDAGDLLAALSESAGETRALRVWRGGRETTLEVAVGEK
jgi:S1-C subfamily serine protease